jgi:Rrf2 family transcriptional regulator, cysteine metabolism repressor
MWVSRRTDYATRAVLALTLEGGGPLKLDDLARRTAVPQSVLEQVMPALRTAGIVRSERGPAGGYRLNKRPEEITLERIVRLFQGQLAPIGCATRHNPEPCPMTIGCTLREVWEEIRDATIQLLGQATFADLAARAGGPWTDPSLLGIESTRPAAAEG